jgi:hypothetical protein
MNIYAFLSLFPKQLSMDDEEESVKEWKNLSHKFNQNLCHLWYIFKALTSLSRPGARSNFIKSRKYLEIFSHSHFFFSQ